MDYAVRGEGVGNVKDDQDGSFQYPARQASFGPQRFSDPMVQQIHRFCPGLIQPIPDLDILRHLMHAEEQQNIVLSGRSVQIPVEGRK